MDISAVIPLNVVFGMAMTLIGVVLGTAYRELQSMSRAGHRRIQSVRTLAKSVVYSVDFWMGLCGSPILFSIIWQSADNLALGPLTIIAIQNGFCCTLVLPALLGRIELKLAAPGSDIRANSQNRKAGKREEKCQTVSTDRLPGDQTILECGSDQNDHPRPLGDRGQNQRGDS